LLLIIFQLVYQQEIGHLGSWWRNDELHSPSLFPHAVAAICSLWRDVMALVPEFWMRVVILCRLDAYTTDIRNPIAHFMVALPAAPYHNNED
jgi:hypothetical protein